VVIGRQAGMVRDFQSTPKHQVSFLYTYYKQHLASSKCDYIIMSHGKLKLKLKKLMLKVLGQSD
jgi:hypothetical protein